MWFAPLFGDNMLQRGIKEITLFPFFLLTPGSSWKQRRVMRVHLLSSMHCTKLSWHNRKFTCNPRPGGQISVGMAEQRQRMKACIRLMLFYRANHDWSSLPALSLFHFLTESWSITVTTSPVVQLFIIGMSPCYISLYRFKLWIKKRQTFSWCRLSTSELVFGFQLNKTRGCHLWAQLIKFKHFNSSSCPLKSRAALNLKKQNHFPFVSKSLIHMLFVVELPWEGAACYLGSCLRLRTEPATQPERWK